MRWKAVIIPKDPNGFFPGNDWRAVGIEFDADSERGAKRIASRWAGDVTGKWRREDAQFVRNSFYGVLLLGQTE